MMNPWGSIARYGQRRICFVIALALLVLCATPVSVAAQGLQGLTLEELMEKDAGRVFGAAERMQPATQAPASVTFVTAAEIKRYGYSTLADILQGVRGMIVTDDRAFSYVGVRGFAKPGDYNSRILLLVNGHRVNDNVYGQAAIGAEFGLDPSTFERIEIIRGPASALYGDSAFFAVVNVITKTGAALVGSSITAETGSYNTNLLRASLGHRYSNTIDFGLSGTLEHSDGVPRLYFPEFDSPLTNNGIADHLDGHHLRQFYGQLHVGNLTFTGAYGTREKDIPTASFGTRFNEQRFKERGTDRHTLLDAEYTALTSGMRVALRASFDRFSSDGVYPFSAGEDDAVQVGLNTVVGERWTLGARATRALSARHTFTAGAELINNLRQFQESRFVDPPEVLFALDRPSYQKAVYAQHEVALPQSVTVTGGLRYDSYEDFSKVTPRFATVWTPTHNQAFKYLYGRAFRAPNAYESNPIYFGERVLTLRPETIATHEVVWERYTADWLRTSVSSYWYNADRLITLIPDPTAFLGGSTYANEGEVRAKGLEFEAQFNGKGRLEGMLSYAVQKVTEAQGGGTLPNSPEHMLKVRGSVPLSTRGSSIAMETITIGPRMTLNGTTVPTATTANLTVVQPLNASFELFGTIRNLFDLAYADPASSALVQNVIYQNGRTFQVGLRWKVLAK